MRQSLVIAAATLALAGCNKSAPKDEAMSPAATASTAAPAPAPTMAMADFVGTWDSTASDGTKSVTTFNSDGSYKDDDAKMGKSIGRFTVNDGKVCMQPSNGKPEACYTMSAPMADGSMTATGPDGKAITVKKRAS